jgi:hypothetical protein
MGAHEGWGRTQGRKVFNELIEFIEHHPGRLVFHVSVKDVKRVDISFASETLVELANRYRGRKGFCFIDLTDVDMLENWDAAAERKNQPIMVWNGEESRVLGPQPSKGTVLALEFALKRRNVKAAEFVASNPEINIQNASMKFKQLWQEGFLLRFENKSESGGIEYVYQRIK